MPKEPQTCFRAMSRDLDPDAVTAGLGLNPTMAHRRGDPHVGREGRRYSDFDESLWAYEITPRAPTVEEQLVALLEPLEAKRTELLALRSAGWRFDFYVGLFDNSDYRGGFGLGAATLRRLAELGARLEIDIFP